MHVLISVFVRAHGYSHEFKHLALTVPNFYSFRGPKLKLKGVPQAKSKHLLNFIVNMQLGSQDPLIG